MPGDVKTEGRQEDAVPFLLSLLCVQNPHFPGLYERWKELCPARLGNNVILTTRCCFSLYVPKTVKPDVKLDTLNCSCGKDVLPLIPSPLKVDFVSPLKALKLKTLFSTVYFCVSQTLKLILMWLTLCYRQDFQRFRVNFLSLVPSQTHGGSTVLCQAAFRVASVTESGLPGMGGFEERGDTVTVCDQLWSWGKLSALCACLHMTSPVTGCLCICLFVTLCHWVWLHACVLPPCYRQNASIVRHRPVSLWGSRSTHLWGGFKVVRAS